MIKFFGAAVQAVKRGLAEGQAEFEAEQAAEQAALVALHFSLEARVAAASDIERFAVALAAPYRQVFLSELQSSQRAKRSPFYLCCAQLPDKEVATWKRLLKRDFSVSNAPEAESVVAELGELMDYLEGPGAAVWIARATHLATGAAGVGYVPVDLALHWLDHAILKGTRSFESWESYAAAFTQSEPAAPGSNFLGSKLIKATVASLLSDERSPWKIMPWPDAETAVRWVGERTSHVEPLVANSSPA